MDNNVTDDLVLQRMVESSKSPVDFINRWCFTFDPKRPPHHLPFNLFPFQIDMIVKEVKQAIDEGYDIFIEKSREMGATYTVLDVLLWFWRYIPGSNFLLGSRKEDYVDNRGNAGKSGSVSNKEESLFGKLDYTLSRMWVGMLPQGFDARKHNTYMSLVNPENGNVISGESSNPNFSRSGRFKAVLMDEFAFWDNDSAAWGATADTTNCRIVITTPGIRPGKAKRLRFGTDGEKIKVIELDYILDPRKTKEWVTKERERRSEEDFAREILRNWDTSVQGKVYKEIERAQVGDFPYNPLWPLYVSWDFGLDGTAIGFWQTNMANGKPRLVDSYFNSDKPIQFFLPLFGRPVESMFQYLSEDLAAIEIFKQFKAAIHFGDPDVAKRAYQDKEKTSTRQVLENVGIYVQTKPSSNTYFERREKTKVMLQGSIEVNNTPRNDYWLSSMKNARYPQRSEMSQATNPVNEPIHDWTSHHRTQTEYFAVNYEPTQEEQAAQEETSAPDWATNKPDWSRPTQ